MKKLTKDLRQKNYVLLALSVMAISPVLFEPAYVGYSIAFVIFLLIQLKTNDRMVINFSIPKFQIFLLIFGFFTIVRTILFDNDIRDELRDAGALFSFYIGYAVLPKIFMKHKDGWRIAVLQTFSLFGVIVALYTFLGAFQAYVAGADAYFWRGMYVPYAHNWLPYFFVINNGLIRLDKVNSSNYLIRTILCFLGTAVSLSRTDIVLMVFVLLVLFAANFKIIIKSRKWKGYVLTLGLAFAIMLPLFLQLDVVQERINVGVDENDPSMTWRFIENFAFIDYYLQSDLLTQLFGSGLGARFSLPYGTVDFDGRDSIPHLHNSFFTIALKFGLIGLLIFIAYILYIFVVIATNKLDYISGVKFSAGWILLFVLAKALTLQGLSEWSHIMFFGLASALILGPTIKTNAVNSGKRMSVGLA